LDKKSILRENVWKNLEKVAKPDSRFHLDFGEFIPDFEGSEKCIEKITALELYKNAKLIMITPDNNLEKLRKECIIDKKTYIMPTYGIRRGFLKLSKNEVPSGQELFSSTLDGVEKFGVPITLKEIKGLKIDFMVTGASIVNTEGVRHGKGHGYFDLEFAMLREIGSVNEKTPIIAVVHDCQVTKDKFPVSPNDTIVDIIITPTRVISVKTKYQKPLGINWKKLPKEMLDAIPPLKELKKNGSAFC
jgi:5-formyltetrahydrofolate cyclo-ligase